MTIPNGYQVVRFSPIPERVEFVNVAVLMYGERPELHYLPGFPKLRCVAGPSYPERLLVAELEYLERLVLQNGPEEGRVAFERMTAQLKVMEFVQTREFASAAQRDRLIQQLLASHGKERRRRPRTRPRIEAQLGEFIEGVSCSHAFLRARPARDLLGDERLAERVFGTIDYRVPRALASERGLLVLDAIDVASGREAVHRRFSQISEGFHAFGEARTALRTTGRELIRVAKIFGQDLDLGRERERDQALELAAWVRDDFDKRGVTELFDPSADALGEKIRQVFDAAVH